MPLPEILNQKLEEIEASTQEQFTAASGNIRLSVKEGRIPETLAHGISRSSAVFLYLAADTIRHPVNLSQRRGWKKFAAPVAIAAVVGIVSCMEIKKAWEHRSPEKRPFTEKLRSCLPGNN